MTNKLTKSFLVCALVASFTACQKAEPTNITANTAPANVSSATNSSPNSTPVNANTAATTATPESTFTFSLATPTDAYKTGYAARKNKDVAALKRVFAKDALEFLTEIAKAENKTIDEQLKELADRPQAATAETRNEKIAGNRATLEYLDERGNWATMDFSKEGNDWKIDLPKAE